MADYWALEWEAARFCCRIISEGPGGHHLPGWDSEASAWPGHPVALDVLQPQTAGRVHLLGGAGGILLWGDFFNIPHYHVVMM